jgi:hypothetical protein
VPKLPFTVIAAIDGTGELKSFEVDADDGLNAFAVAAHANKELSLDFVVAIPGHQKEGEGFTLPGEGLVCIETVLEQTDVFGGVDDQASLIDRLRSVGYDVMPSKSQIGRFRWWKDIGGDGVSVPPKELSDTTFSNERGAWLAVLEDGQSTEVGFDDDAMELPDFDGVDDTAPWLDRVRALYPDIGPKEAYRLAKRDYMDNDGIL